MSPQPPLLRLPQPGDRARASARDNLPSQAGREIFHRALIWAWLLFISLAGPWRATAEPVANPVASSPATETNSGPHFAVTAYQVQGKYLLATNLLVPLFVPYTGTNVSLDQILHAASALELAYVQQGYPNMNIVVAPKPNANGIVTLDAFPGALAQVVIAGYRYSVSSNGVEVAINPPAAAPAAPPLSAASVAATATANATATATNAGPRFTVNKYQVLGNTLLPANAISQALTNVPGAFGTNVGFENIREEALQLQAAYRERGFVTVNVTLPPQKLTNATVKLHVIEGRLLDIAVKGNHYFSSENVLRNLPSLRTNMILNGQIFQAELNRANANQDRQIYPIIDPGPDPGTSDLTLKVQDRPPVHGKVDLDNQNSPGTPVLRLNTSAVYDNLWQRENSLGVQYGFSPEEYKAGPQWNFYDLPLVANYSAFYRLPLGNPDSIEEVIAANPGTFGYSEATRKFTLPPASGQPELNFFASRSTIDTGLNSSPLTTLSTTSVTNADNSIVTNSTLKTATLQEDLTVNNDLGVRLTIPLPATADFHSALSAGLDYKTYQVTSSSTNVFYINGVETDYITPPTSIPITGTNNSEVPLTVKRLEYLPLSLHYDGGWRDEVGQGTFGLGLSVNTWLSGLTSIAGPTNSYYRGVKSLQQITGSAESSGYWVIFNPSFSHTFELVTNWITTIRADGQWASQPLISNEQFGAGGVNSVRGYHEGEVFGDTGWHLSLEQQTPPYVVGTVFGQTPLTLRGSTYLDFAKIYLLNPQGNPGSTSLLGVGCGAVAAVGSHWQARWLVSVPLIDTATIQADHAYFNFMLTAQF